MSVTIDPGAKIQITVALLKVVHAAIVANEDYIVVDVVEHDDESGYVRLTARRSDTPQPET